MTRPVPPESRLDRRLRPALQRLAEQHRYRHRRVLDGPPGVAVTVEGRTLRNFCSNDYLGLSAHPRVVAAARRAFDEAGVGSTASPLVCGHHRHHRALEEALAEFLGAPRVLSFSSGWAANLGVLRALLGRQDRLVADELNHASLIDGGRLSGAAYQRYPHGDLAQAEALLQTPHAGLTLLVSDTVFSMDGDLADLPGLSRAAQRARAVLMVDDAHGFGVLGAGGQGAVAHWTERDPAWPAPEVYVATLGKSLGGAGAFVAGSETLIEYLIQRARPWIYSTAPPPALAAAAREALAILEAEPERRSHLRALIQRFRAGAQALGLPLLPSETPIQPLVLGTDAAALAASQGLERLGFWVAAIRPPTVPEGSARLRITLSAAHRASDVEALLEALAAVVPQAEVA